MTTYGYTLMTEQSGPRELVGHAAAAEQAAAKDTSKTLGENDPVPLTLYHCNAKQGDTMLISVPIILGAR